MMDLDDKTLWAIAREQMPPKSQQWLATLLDRNSRGLLSKQEYKELEKLWEISQRLKLRKAEAIRRLMERGYSISVGEIERLVIPQELEWVADTRPFWRKALRLTRTKLIVLGIILFVTLPCTCPFLLVIWHDYYPPKSDLSALHSADAVQAALEKELIVQESSRQDVLDVLDNHHVEKCYVTETYGIECSIPTRSPILGTDRGYLLLTEEDYVLSFTFAAGKLVLIQVRYVATGP